MRPGRRRPQVGSARPVSGWAGGCWPRCLSGWPARWPHRTTGGAWLRGWRLLAIDGFDVDLPATPGNAEEFGYGAALLWRAPTGLGLPVVKSYPMAPTWPSWSTGDPRRPPGTDPRRGPRRR